MPRPWISRTSAKPRAWAAIRYSSTTERTSAGRKEWRSGASSMGRWTGSSASIGRGTPSRVPPFPSMTRVSEAWAGLQVLGPVLKAREILPRELALSERGRALEEGHVHHRDVLGARRVRHLLGDHLAHERDRDAAEPVQDLVGAADAGARQHRALVGGRLVGIVLARLGDELLQPQRHVLGHPGLEPRLRVGEPRARALELVV